MVRMCNASSPGTRCDTAEKRKQGGPMSKDTMVRLLRVVVERGSASSVEEMESRWRGIVTASIGRPRMKSAKNSGLTSLVARKRMRFGRHVGGRGDSVLRESIPRTHKSVMAG
jgi:hypothetical protein